MKSCALVILLSLLIMQELHLVVGDLANCPYYDLYSPAAVLEIKLNDSKPFSVPCDGQGAMNILNRSDGSENFDRNWTDYKEEFGKLCGEFFLGLEKLHLLYILLMDANEGSLPSFPQRSGNVHYFHVPVCSD